MALIFRSSSGFRLIRMRPLLSVVLVPSTPMNDDKLSTAGSFKITCGERLLPFGHRGERNVLRGVGNAVNYAGVLHGKKSLRHDDVEQNCQDQRADASRATWQSGGVKHPLQCPSVKFNGAIVRRVLTLRKSALGSSRRLSL